MNDHGVVHFGYTWSARRPGDRPNGYTQTTRSTRPRKDMVATGNSYGSRVDRATRHARVYLGQISTDLPLPPPTCEKVQITRRSLTTPVISAKAHIGEAGFRGESKAYDGQRQKQSWCTVLSPFRKNNPPSSGGSRTHT